MTRHREGLEGRESLIRKQSSQGLELGEQSLYKSLEMEKRTRLDQLGYSVRRWSNNRNKTGSTN